MVASVVLIVVKSGTLPWSGPLPPPARRLSIFIPRLLEGRESQNEVEMTGANLRDISAQLSLHVSYLSHILLHLNLILPVFCSHVAHVRMFLEVVLPLLVKLL